MAKHISQIEMVQRRAVRFIISNLRGKEGVTSESEALGLKLLQDKRKDARVKLLLKILLSVANSLLQIILIIISQLSNPVGYPPKSSWGDKN